jgi:2-polyprenyl-3-methyl-5-hydroxy-6-metoxy-1,4-benzoquinol methylase
MKNCNLCGVKSSSLITFGEYPIVNNLLEVEYVTEPLVYDFSLCICEECGLAQIERPIEPKFFYTNYATPSGEKPNPHLEILIENINQLVSKDSRIIEIGSNDGTFLDKLQASGFENISGLEPTMNTYRTSIIKGHNVVDSFLNSQTALELIAEGLFEVVISRQVLEHISDLKEFGSALNLLLCPNGYLIIEVPNCLQNISNFDFSLWEEHVNYFTPLTLRIFLNSIGFEVVQEWNSIFAGETLSVIAKKINKSLEVSNSVEIESGSIKSEILMWRKWSRNFENFKSVIQNEIYFISKGKDLILYGVGARSSVVLNFLGLSNRLKFAIDDSLAKQNKLMPYSKTKIISLSQAKLESKKKGGGEVVILLGINAENEENIIENNTFVNQNSYISILPPSKNLPKAWKQFISDN